VVRHWRKHQAVTNPEFFYGVADELRRTILLPDVLARCCEMASLDLVSRELVQEFDGQDLRSRQLVEKAETTCGPGAGEPGAVNSDTLTPSCCLGAAMSRAG
jgi:hypothetical protein